MNREIRQAFLDLYHEMVQEHLRYYANSMILDYLDDVRRIAKLRSDRYKIYGRVLDQIRCEIEVHGYSRSQHHDLGIILRFLRELDDSELSETLQSIIDSLGNPQLI